MPQNANEIYRKKKSRMHQLVDWEIKAFLAGAGKHGAPPVLQFIEISKLSFLSCHLSHQI